MREDTALLLLRPDRGLSYQVAGALQRLGSRMAGILRTGESSAAIKHVPMPTVAENDLATAMPAGMTHALVAPHPGLSVGADLPNAEWTELLATHVTPVAAQLPQAVWIWVVPESTPVSRIETLHAAHPSIVFRTPALFGFRDDGLLDRSLELAAENPARLTQALRALPADLRFAYAGDLAALVASALGRRDLVHTTVNVPPMKENLAQWGEAFRTHFSANVGAWDQLRSLVRAGSARDWPAALVTPAAPAMPPAMSRDAFEVFPTAPSSLERVFRELAAHHKRNPEMGLVHPPSRGL